MKPKDPMKSLPLKRATNEMREKFREAMERRAAENVRVPGPRGRTIIEGYATTSGDGFWSNEKRRVFVSLEVAGGEITGPGRYGGRHHGQLHANFLKRDWDTQRLGLIYTDHGFLGDVKDALKKAGMKNYGDLEYSEQGMQGGVGFHMYEDFVDFDIGDALARELVDKGYATIGR